MCGFAGVFDRECAAEEIKSRASGMSRPIRFRGPDEAGTEEYGGVAFSFRRLSIIDLSGGSQPKTENGGKIVGVFNGEIYNYLELKENIAGEFSTNSELEVMLKLFSEKGTDFIPLLRGMFAVAFYDSENKKIVLARDPFGIKPLYYRVTEKGLSFASEAKAFAFDDSFPGFSATPEQIQNYFTYQYIPSEEFPAGVKILSPGTFAVYDTVSGEISVTRYFDPMLRSDKTTPYEEKKRRLREAVEDSVKHHMISDVPVGTFLSSGVDSAVVTALASKFNPGIKAYTVSFGEREYSEAEDADAISRHIEVEHINVICDVEDFKNAFEKVVFALDYPVADPSTVAIFLVCERASKDLKVVLSGEGADEIFGGYRVYDESRYSSRIYSFPAPVKSVIRAIANILPDCVKGKNFLLRGTTPLEERFFGNAFIFTEKEKKKFLKTFDPSFSPAVPCRDVYLRAKENGLSPMQKMQYVDLSTWLRGDILVKGDRLSMYNSLEVRVPFLDKEVFSAASDLLDGEKLRAGTTKFIFRDAFRDLIDDATYRRPKLGYPVPVRKWLKNELYGWAKDIILNMTCEDIIDRGAALRMLEDHKNGKKDNFRKIWCLIVFITWYRLYVTDIEETKKRVIAGEL